MQRKGNVIDENSSMTLYPIVSCRKVIGGVFRDNIHVGSVSASLLIRKIESSMEMARDVLVLWISRVWNSN
jgi:hypothetical protein